MPRALVLILMLFPLLAIAAGPGDRRPPDPERRFEALVEQLSLRVDQQASVRQALDEHHELVREFGRDARQQREALDSQLQAELARVLDPDQLSRWESLHSQRRPPPRQGHRQRGERAAGTRAD
jgi:uncharacterized membrane protein